MVKKDTYTHYKFDYADNELNRIIGRNFFKKAIIGTAVAIISGVIGFWFHIVWTALLSPFIFGGALIYAGLSIKDNARQFGEAWLGSEDVKIKLRTETFHIQFKAITTYKMPGFNIRVIIKTSDGQKLRFKPPTARWGYNQDSYDLKDDRRWDNFINALDKRYQRFLIKEKL